MILAGVKPIERRLFANRRPRAVKLVIDRREISLSAIASAIGESRLSLRQITILPGDAPEEDHLEITLNRAQSQTLIPLTEKLLKIPGVREITQAGA